MKRALTHVKQTPTWIITALFLISAIFAVHALRQNNFQMIKLRTALYAADKSGQNVQGSLNNLRNYVYSHMNTNLSSGGNAIKPPIQLQYTYGRLVKAEQDRIDQANRQIYLNGKAYCQAHDSSKYRQACFQNYVNSHGVKSNEIPAALYQFDFISPSWSPDLAGWSLILSIILGIAFLISYGADKLAASRLKQHKKS